MTAQPDILALFDLDHTLLPHDSDEKWVEFLIEEGALDREVFEHANRELRARYQRGEAGALEFTEFYLSTLTPFAQEQLTEWHQAFMRRKVLPAISRAARDLIERHRAAFESANRELGERYRRGEAGAVEFAEFYLSTLRPFTTPELDALHVTYMRERILPSIAPPRATSSPGTASLAIA